MKSRSLKSLFFASFTGRIIYAVASLITLPFLAEKFGVEGVGLIGFFSTIVMVMMVLEGGLTSNLINLLAGINNKINYAPKRYFVYSYGMINSHLYSFLILGAIIALSFNFTASVAAKNWLIIEDLPVAVVIDSIKWIGIFVGINFIVVVAQGVLTGREQQIQMSILYTVYSLVRTIGVVVSILFLPSDLNIAEYFKSQVFCQCLYLIGLIYFVYKDNWSAIIEVRPRLRYVFSGGVYSRDILALSITSVLVVQSDKLYLSGTVTLGDYAAYSLAATIASVPYICSSALYSVIFPRFSVDINKGSLDKIREVFTSALCGILILMMVLCTIVWMFSEIPLRLLFETELTAKASNILPVLMLGTAIQSLLVVPFALQLACRWTSLSLRLNIYLVPVFLICLFVLVKYLGVIGAAYSWLIYNALSLVCTMYFMIKRLNYISSAINICFKVVLFMSVVSVFPLYLSGIYIWGGAGDFSALVVMLIVSAMLLSIGALRFRRELSGFL